MPNRQVCKAHIDIGYLIDAMGGQAAVQRALIRHKMPVPTQMTITQWKRRSSLPGPWLLMLLLCAQYQGIEFRLENLLLREDIDL